MNTLYKSPRMHLLIVPLFPTSVEKLEMYCKNFSSGMNIEFLIMNEATDTIDLIIFHQHKHQRFENRKSNYSGVYTDRNLNWHLKPLRILAPGNHSLYYRNAEIMQNYDLLQFEIIANFLNATLKFQHTINNGMNFFIECDIRAEKKSLDMCLNTHSQDIFNTKYLENVFTQEVEGFVVLVPKNPLLNLNIFFQPFDQTFWKFMLAQLIISAIAWTVFFEVHKCIHGKVKTEHKILLSLTELTISAAVSKKADSNILKWLYGSQILFNFIITTCYSSSIISCMLNPNYHYIDSIEQFKENNMTLIVKSSIQYNIRMFKMENVSIKVNTSIKSRISPMSKLYYLNKVNLNIGFLLSKKNADRYLNSKEYLFGNVAKYHIMKQVPPSILTALPIASELRLTESLQILMMHIDQSGLRRRWDTLVNMQEEIATQKNLVIKSNEVQLITVKELSIIFWYLSITLLISFIVFLSELIYYWIKQMTVALFFI